MPSAPKPARKPKRNPLADWRKEKAAWLGAHPSCEVRFYPASGPCSGPVQVHHIQPRGSGGSRRTDLLLVTACMGHHQKIESERVWAKSVGLLRKRTAE